MNHLDHTVPVEILDYTGHGVTLLDYDDQGDITGTVGRGESAMTVKFRTVLRIQPSGQASAWQTDETIPPLITTDGVIVRRTRRAFGATIGLPAPRDGVKLVVSLITAQAARAEGRTVTDLLTPNEMVTYRGTVVGCLSLTPA
jgi:hypothetical protein